MEVLLTIASFAISVGGIVHILFFNTQKKQIVLAIIVSAVVATSGITLNIVYRHETMISRVEKEIIGKLSYNTWTFDQIYNELHYVSFPIASEALFRLVRDHKIEHKTIEFRNREGEILQVKGYFVASER